MINASEFLLLVGRTLFILLGVLTFFDFWRERGRVRFDIALMFGTLAITSIIDIVELTTELPHWLSVLSSIGVMAQPYFLLRLAEHFYILNRWVKWTAVGTLLLSAMIYGTTEVHTLDALCDRLGVVIPPELRHTALGDAQATAEVLCKMLAMLHSKGIETLSQAIAEAKKHKRLLEDLN